MTRNNDCLNPIFLIVPVAKLFPYASHQFYGLMERFTSTMHATVWISAPLMASRNAAAQEMSTKKKDGDTSVMAVNYLEDLSARIVLASAAPQALMSSALLPIFMAMS